MVEGSLAFPLEVIDITAGQVSGETIKATVGRSTRISKFPEDGIS
jgi:hypothetical protein